MMITIALLALAADVAPPDAAKPETAAWRLDAIRKHFDGLECKELIAEADKLTSDVAQYVTLSDADHDDLLFREAYCYVAQGNDTAAEKLFALIVHENVDWHPSINVEDRISDRLEGARAREKKKRDDAVAAERQKVKDGVKLAVHPPLNVAGGQRAKFVVDVIDGNHSVKSLRLDFVKEGEHEPYRVPLYRSADGSWRGEIAGTYTRTRRLLHILWFVTASDDAGDLVSVGTSAAPVSLSVTPNEDGAVDLTPVERLSKPTRLFYALVGAPSIAASGFVATAGVTDALAIYLVGQSKPQSLQLGAWASIVALAALPPLIGIAGLLVGTQFLLDADEVLIPTGVVAAAVSLWTIGVLIGNEKLIRGETSAINGRPPAPALDNGAAGFGLSLLGAVLGLAGSVIVPTVIVGIDNLKDNELMPDNAPSLQPKPGEKSVR